MSHPLQSRKEWKTKLPQMNETNLFFFLQDIWSHMVTQIGAGMFKVKPRSIVLSWPWHLPIDKIKGTLGWRGFHFTESVFSEVFKSIPFRHFLSCLFHIYNDKLQLKHRYYHPLILLTYFFLTFQCKWSHSIMRFDFCKTLWLFTKWLNIEGEFSTPNFKSQI